MEFRRRPLPEWEFFLAEEFRPEFQALPDPVIDEFFTQVQWIERFGPQAKRPRIDTLKGSRHENMKELRFEAADGIWRFAFAFDPERRAIILVAGDKSGVSESRFYRQLIMKADLRYDSHLKSIEANRDRRR